jgi:hypothetical protein
MVHWKQKVALAAGRRPKSSPKEATMETRKWLHLSSIIALIVAALAALTPGGSSAHAAGLGSATNGTWVIDTVQSPSQAAEMGARSLALDLYGHPHIAFGSNHLYYAHNDGSSWQVELVDPAEGVGGSASLALDAAGRPHISYFDGTNGDLKYAAYDGATWRIERLDSDGWVGLYSSLALSAAGQPQVSYYDSTNHALKLAWHDETGWHSAALDSMTSYRPGDALVLDASGYPHLAYASNGLKYAYVDASNTWHYDTADSLASAGGAISLALDSQGRPHVTYCDTSGWGYCTALRYAYHDGTQWQVQVVNPGDWGGEYNSLVLDSADQPHVAYQTGYYGGPLGYAWYDGSAWRTESVDPCGLYPSLVLDPAGRPRISYYSGCDAALRYAQLVPPTFADPAFEAVWQRTDQPIAAGLVARSWMWGPRPFTAATFEPYADSPGGSRLVQYFDKSRMEINDPNGDRSSPWFVTNGLLVREMVDGWLQLGDSTFESRAPAGEAVAGDPVAHNPNCPTYASFTLLTGPAASRLGQPVTATLARDGSVGDDPTKTGYGGTPIAYYEQVTGHNVPAVLWDFMHQSGLIYSGGRYRSGLVVDWLFAMGYPISEPYWTRCTVAGVEQDVLVQLFERRVLTYTPSNPAGWQVEMGNVGRHYYTWRYGVEPEP